MIIPDKSRKTAAELKLMIEEKLLAGHPDCERAEVVINPPAAGQLGRQNVRLVPLADIIRIGCFYRFVSSGFHQIDRMKPTKELILND